MTVPPTTDEMLGQLKEALAQDDASGEPWGFVATLVMEWLKEKEVPPPPPPPVACKGFQWIGQPMDRCDGCGRPAWEHDYDERMKKGSSPFSGESEYLPWPTDVIGRWLDRGLITPGRAISMLSRIPNAQEGPT